jgi:hypothetical protein
MAAEIVTTKMGQASHMGKWEAACQMVRLVADMREFMEDALTPQERLNIDGIVHTFLDTLPEKCREEVREG